MRPGSGRPLMVLRPGGRRIDTAGQIFPAVHAGAAASRGRGRRLTWGRAAGSGTTEPAAVGPLAARGLVGPPALQQGGQLLPEEDEEIM